MHWNVLHWVNYKIWVCLLSDLKDIDVQKQDSDKILCLTWSFNIQVENKLELCKLKPAYYFIDGVGCCYFIDVNKDQSQSHTLMIHWLRSEAFVL